MVLGNVSNYLYICMLALVEDVENQLSIPS